MIAMTTLETIIVIMVISIAAITGPTMIPIIKIKLWQ